MNIAKILILTLAVALSGCGYTTKSSLPPEWKTIYVAPVQNNIDFTNRTIRHLYTPLLEVKLRNALSQGLLRDGYLRIANSAEEADVVLHTALRDFRHDPLRYDSDNTVREWRVTLIADVELWDANGEVFTEAFAGSVDQFRFGTKAISEDVAVGEAVDDLAKAMIARITEHW